MDLSDRSSTPPTGSSRSALDAVLRRARLAVWWPRGVARVVRQRLPGGPQLHRSGGPGGVDDLPAAVPSTVDTVGVQGAADGVGPLLHRCYAVDVVDAGMDAAAVMAAVQADPNAVVPEIAVFDKTRGVPGRLAVGDEFMIRMPGPWDGPVRVAEVTPTSFLLLTLTDHLEAGQIAFRAIDRPDGGLRVEIESWARPGDWFSHLAYNRFWVAREVQLTLWVQTCLAVATRSGGRPVDGVHIETRRVDADPDWRRDRSSSSATHFPFASLDDAPAALGRALRIAGVRPATDGVRIDARSVTATFGPWRLSTPLSNVAGAEVGGPYTAWKVLGPRLSLADGGLTFGTSPHAGVCIRFHEPVPGIEPFGLLRHPGLTVTVAEPALLVAALAAAIPGESTRVSVS